MTIEQKARAYDEALEKAKQIIVDYDYDEHNNVFMEIFPELRENESERIRKEIIYHIQNCDDTIDEQTEKRMVAWLEKQGQKQNYQTPINIDIDAMVKAYKERLWKQCKTTGDYAFVNACAAAFKEGIENTLDELKLKDFINKNKEKSINNYKPKFKVSDWITNGACTIQITSIDDGYYWHDNDCVGGDIESIDKEYHLWTIHDAKGGDVLASELCDSIILFKGIEDNNIQFYCDYDFSEIDVPGDRFAINNGQHYGNVEDSKDFQPATKEQRNILMKAMKEAGYEWDADKKELRKIEQKPAEWKQENVEELSEFENAMMHIGYSFFGKRGGLDPNDTSSVKVQAQYLLELAQKPAAWSEEDEKNRDLVNKILWESVGKHLDVPEYGSVITQGDAASLTQWLKALKERIVN